jgi:hypothetical protein
MTKPRFEGCCELPDYNEQQSCTYLLNDISSLSRSGTAIPELFDDDSWGEGSSLVVCSLSAERPVLGLRELLRGVMPEHLLRGVRWW